MNTKRTTPPRMQWLATGVLAACAVAWTTPAGSEERPAKRETAAAQAQGAAADARHVRASRLIGSEVRDRDGRSLGHITDLVLDVEKERVRYAVLSFGGVLGAGDKYFPYPVQALRTTADGQLMLNVPRARLERAPGFERNRWPRGDDRRYWSDVDRYFEQEAPLAQGERDAARLRLVRATHLIGKDIDDRTGANAGEVEDVVVSPSDGRLRYLIVEFDPGWLEGEKLLTLPATALTVREDGDAVLNVARERLDMQRGFDEHEWPDLNDPAYRRQVEGGPATTAAGQLTPPFPGR